jgi:flagellar biosynthesis protein FlhF
VNIQTFRGSDVTQVSLAAQLALGEDAMTVRTRIIRSKPTPMVEIVAAAAADVQRLRKRLEAKPILPPAVAERTKPLVLAMVGPTGAGKTTTLAKLAVHPGAFGGWKVGLLTFDTFRTGALEQLESYAAVTGMPLEVVYAKEEVAAAMARLAGCDVILIDTPGRSPKHAERNAAWIEMVRAASPDEVHLVLPASMRLDVALAALDAYESLGLTHVLLTKLDEVNEDAGVADAAVELRLPARWIADGQEIPLDLHPAVQRILGSLAGYTGAGMNALRIPA